MPVDALPQPWPESSAEASYRRTFVDSLGRPLEGELTVERLNPPSDETTVVIAAPVAVPLAAGELTLDLPPGIYRVRGQLRTAGREQVTYDDTVTVRLA